MAGITFGGLSSGLPPNLVDQLIEAERMPIKRLEERKGKSQSKLDLVGELETRLNGVTENIGTLASSRGFNDMKLISGDSNIIQGVVDPETAVPGSWNIEVRELASKAASITNGFPDKDRTEVGVGYFKFESPEGTKDVYISGSNSTLQGVANQINAANVGVRATVINDRKYPDEPFKLMISGLTTGNDNRINFPTLYFLGGDQDIYFDQANRAKNGLVKVDSFEFEVTDNTLEDLIPGVTLELKQSAPGRNINISIKEDIEVISSKVGEFVSSMNEVLNFIQQQNRIDQNTDTSRTLGGDSILRSVENRLRNLIQDMQVGVGGKIVRLNQLGVTFNRNGALDFDQKLFSSTLAQGPEDVQRFFIGDNLNVGFIPSLKRTINTVLDNGFGPIALRKRALRDKIQRADQRIENKERQLVRKEQSLRRKFSKLEETMSRLKTQGASLGAGASSLPNLGLSINKPG